MNGGEGRNKHSDLMTDHVSIQPPCINSPYPHSNYFRANLRYIFKYLLMKLCIFKRQIVPY